MPSDIRSFFGGKPAGTPAPAPPAKETKKRGRPKTIVSDDEDDEPVKKATPKRAAAQNKPEPALEETTADDFFGKGSKPKRTSDAVRRSRGKASTEATPQKSTGKVNDSKATPTRGSTRAKKNTNYVDLAEDDFPDDDLEDNADDVFKTGAAVGRRLADDYEEGSDDEDDKPIVPKKRASAKQKKVKDEDDFEPDGDVDMKDINAEHDFVVPGDDEDVVVDKPARKTSAKYTTKKRKSTALEEGDDDLEIEEAKPAKKVRCQACMHHIEDDYTLSVLWPC